MTRVENIRRKRQEVVTRVGDNDLEELALARVGETRREDDKDEEVLALAILGEPGQVAGLRDNEGKCWRTLQNFGVIHTEST